MCGRFSNHIKAMHQWSAIFKDWPYYQPVGYNVAPDQIIPVLTKKGGLGMRWGLIPSWSKEGAGNFATFNAKSETVETKPAFRSAWKKGQRCLIPIQGYYEWKKERTFKQPYFFYSAEESPLVLACIWDQWGYHNDKVDSFSILTRPASSQIENIHPRMPILIQLDQAKAWLDKSNDVALDIINSNSNINITYHKVSTKVNNPSNQGEPLIKKTLA